MKIKYTEFINEFYTTDDYIKYLNKNFIVRGDDTITRIDDPDIEFTKEEIAEELSNNFGYTISKSLELVDAWIDIKK